MTFLALFAVVVASGLMIVAVRDLSVRLRAINRLSEDDHRLTDGAVSAGSENALARWLSAGGYRDPNAPTTFVVATLGCAGIGVVLAQLYQVVLLPRLIGIVGSVPGSAAEVMAALLQGGPWLIFVGGSLWPTVVVRGARRTRARAIERDLPLVLELFATMAEAGLGFDAALSNIVRARTGESPLISEFVNFQLDMLAGVSRVHALRQLARRVDIPALTRFTSALIQAEQAGASTADTLQHQAEDLRQRRREDALLQAQALPVKLVFPLVVCFLPGIFVSTLAPVIYQMILMAESVLGLAGR